MAERVTDEMVRSWFAWAQNFGEVVGCRIGDGAGRRFRVRLPAGVTRNGAPFRPRVGMLDITGHSEDDVVPAELLFTAREALAFAYGCAAARAAALGGGPPEWAVAEWTSEARETFDRRRELACEEDQAERLREMAEREAERQRRIADYRRRRGLQRQIEAGVDDGA